MATHNLFQGGAKPMNAHYLAYPSREIPQGDDWRVDARHQTDWEVTRHISFREPERCVGTKTDRVQDSDLWNFRCFMEQQGTPLAAADVLNVIPVPNGAMPQYLRIRNFTAAPGGLVTVQLRNTAGNASTTIGVIEAGLDLSVEGDTYVDLTALNGATIFTDQGHDMIQIVLDALPTDGIAELDVEVQVIGRCFNGTD